ncbi:hypothetical protein SNEBB_006668 [Seison nebaliae]|nr:hypothetical protein SNEBB_006668 [Seison nebaliae]
MKNYKHQTLYVLYIFILCNYSVSVLVSNSSDSDLGDNGEYNTTKQQTFEEEPETFTDQSRTVSKSRKKVPKNYGTNVEHPETISRLEKLKTKTIRKQHEAVSQNPNTIPKQPETIRKLHETVTENPDTIPHLETASENPDNIPRQPEIIRNQHKRVSKNPNTILEQFETILNQHETVSENPDTILEQPNKFRKQSFSKSPKRIAEQPDDFSGNLETTMEQIETMKEKSEKIPEPSEIIVPEPDAVSEQPNMFPERTMIVSEKPQAENYPIDDEAMKKFMLKKRITLKQLNEPNDVLTIKQNGSIHYLRQNVSEDIKKLLLKNKTSLPNDAMLVDYSYQMVLPPIKLRKFLTSTSPATKYAIFPLQKFSTILNSRLNESIYTISNSLKMPLMKVEKGRLIRVYHLFIIFSVILVIAIGVLSIYAYIRKKPNLTNIYMADDKLTPTVGKTKDDTRKLSTFSYYQFSSSNVDFTRPSIVE